MKKLRFLSNISLGGCLGLIFGIGFCWIFDSSLSESLIKYGTYLISAVITLFASGIALYGVLANIENSREQTLRSSNAKLKAARAALPMTLSQLSDQIDDTRSKLLKSLSSETERELLIQEAIRNCRIDSDLLKSITLCIEATYDSSASDWLTLLVHTHQIISSRTAGILDPKTDGDIFRRETLDERTAECYAEWCTVKTILNQLWDFARANIEPPKELDVKKIQAPMSIRGNRNFDLINGFIAREQRFYKNCSIHTFPT